MFVQAIPPPPKKVGGGGVHPPIPPPGIYASVILPCMGTIIFRQFAALKSYSNNVFISYKVKDKLWSNWASPS